MSKELKAFETLKLEIEGLKIVINSLSYNRMFVEDSELDKALKIIETALKILEILKKHKVNLYDLSRVDKVSEYNYFCILEDYQKLTQKKFEIIKGWLKNEKFKKCK